jgi:hypothetical protein
MFIMHLKPTSHHLRGSYQLDFGSSCLFPGLGSFCSLSLEEQEIKTIIIKHVTRYTYMFFR